MASKQFQPAMPDRNDSNRQPGKARWSAIGAQAGTIAALLMLMTLFVFVPLLQGVQLSAGQDRPAADDPARKADRLVSAEVLELVRQP